MARRAAVRRGGLNNQRLVGIFAAKKNVCLYFIGASLALPYKTEQDPK